MGSHFSTSTRKPVQAKENKHRRFSSKKPTFGDTFQTLDTSSSDQETFELHPKHICMLRIEKSPANNKGVTFVMEMDTDAKSNDNLPDTIFVESHVNTINKKQLPFEEEYFQCLLKQVMHMTAEDERKFHDEIIAVLQGIKNLREKTAQLVVTDV